MEVVTKRGVTCVKLDDGTIVKEPSKVRELIEEMEKPVEEQWTTEDLLTQPDSTE